MSVAVPGVVLNTLHDLCGERHSIPAIFAADTRTTAGANAADEVLQLARQLIALVAIQFQDLQVLAKKIIFERWFYSRVERMLFRSMPNKPV